MQIFYFTILIHHNDLELDLIKFKTSYILLQRVTYESKIYVINILIFKS